MMKMINGINLLHCYLTGVFLLLGILVLVVLYDIYDSQKRNYKYSLSKKDYTDGIKGILFIVFWPLVLVGFLVGYTIMITIVRYVVIRFGLTKVREF